MSTKLTPTLALVIAAGIAAGVALARPPATPAVPTTEPGTPSTTYPAELPQAAPGTPATIEISGFTFTGPLTVAPGQAVSVSNLDEAEHTVTSDAFDTGAIPGRGTGSFTAPTEPGTYQFFCAIHPSMQGELIVQG